LVCAFFFFFRFFSRSGSPLLRTLIVVCFDHIFSPDALVGFDQLFKFGPASFDIDFEIQFVILRKESLPLVPPHLVLEVLFDVKCGIDGVFADLEVLVALALYHFQQKPLTAEVDIIGYVEVEFAQGNGHLHVSVLLCKVGLDGAFVFVELVVAWIHRQVPLWIEKRKVVPWAGSSLLGPTRLSTTGTI
jgi:hypothetical protein